MLRSVMLVCLMCVLFVNLISFLKNHYCTVQVDLSLVVLLKFITEVFFSLVVHITCGIPTCVTAHNKASSQLKITTVRPVHHVYECTGSS